MRNPFRKEPKSIDVEIDRVISEMSVMKPDDPQYGLAVKHLEILSKARSYKPSDEVSGESWLVAITAVGQVILILFHERAEVIATKAIGFVIKGRLG